jgi:hypothetical protein
VDVILGGKKRYATGDGINGVSRCAGSSELRTLSSCDVVGASVDAERKIGREVIGGPKRAS